MSTFEQKLFHALQPKRSVIRKRRKGGARRGPWRSEAKRRWIASLPCLVTGKAAQCAHVQNNGMRSKGSDEFTVPFAPEIHDQFDGRAKLPNGQIGKAVFEDYYGLDLLTRAIELHADWLGIGREPECDGRFVGDIHDASECPLHGVSRPPAVRLVMEESNGDSIPF